MSTESNVNNVLNSIELDAIGQPLGKVAKVRCDESQADRLRVAVQFDIPLARSLPRVREQIEGALRQHFATQPFELELSSNVIAHAVQGNLTRVTGIKNIIAIASGKGGVGKSTVAANIALALADEGAAVGVLDADIYGPSQPHLLNLVGENPLSEDGKTMLPLEGHGLKVMSIGFLVDPDQPMVWRGPMVTSALNQLMHQTQWGDLDYLIVDMPPGTGDIQLTLSQKVPVSGAVIVTTPQDIATLDARKGLAMFRKVSISVLGVVENMSQHVCSNCGHVEAIFGSGGADTMVHDFAVPLLGRLPLHASIREHADRGAPSVLSEPDSDVAGAYRAAALNIAMAQNEQRTDYSGKFGNIVVEDTK